MLYYLVVNKEYHYALSIPMPTGFPCEKWETGLPIPDEHVYCDA